VSQTSSIILEPEEALVFVFLFVKKKVKGREEKEKILWVHPVLATQ
jgi:hypothetical protein